MVFLPLRALVGDELLLEFGAEHLLGEGIVFECLDRLGKCLGKWLNPFGPELFVGKLVKVIGLRRAGVQSFPDALETRGERERTREVGIAGGVCIARFATTAAHRDADRIGAIVCAKAIEDGSPGVIAHRSAANQAFVAIHRRSKGRAESAPVL